MLSLIYERINLLSGTFTIPFIDCVIESTGTVESATILFDIIAALHQHKLDCECIRLLQLFSDAIGAPFLDEINETLSDEALVACFIDEHLKDIEDLLCDLL